MSADQELGLFENDGADLEKDFLRAATLWLADRGVFEWRNNTGMAHDPGTGRHVRFGIPGGSDLLCVVPPFGRFMGVETKAKLGRQSTKQKTFQRAVEAAGGVYVLAKTIEQLRRGFEYAQRFQAPPVEGRGEWMCTYTGKRFHPYDPSPDEICIEDIAHALSIENRYGGHLPEPYSVSHHSLLVAWVTERVLNGSRADVRDALMHDSAEAYIKDIPRPLKKNLVGYKSVEDRVEAVIASKFGLRHPMPKMIKEADLIALAIERRDLFPASHQQLWSTQSLVQRGLPADLGRVAFRDWRACEQRFLERWQELNSAAELGA